MKESIYSGKLRVRVAGLLIEDAKLLLINLVSPVSKQEIWTPPGGGVQFGESMEEALKREFAEETNLEIEVLELIYINELIELPFHAIEMFYRISRVGGEMELGKDPELKDDEQILKKLRFFSIDEVQQLAVKPDYLKKVANLFRNDHSHN